MPWSLSKPWPACNHSDSSSGKLWKNQAHVQAQLKALATGSAVDALSEDDVTSIIVPYDDSALAAYFFISRPSALRISRFSSMASMGPSCL